MAVECLKGWILHTGPSTPPDSNTIQGGPTITDGATYVRVSYEWELADNSTPPTCACGQACTFNFGYGYNSEGSIEVAPWGVGGGVGGGITGYTELSVNVGPDKYEYIGYKVVLKQTTETGTVTTSGGFLKGKGFWYKVKTAFRVLWHGAGALIPSVTYNPPHTTTTKHIQAAWKICKKQCPRARRSSVAVKKEGT